MLQGLELDSERDDPRDLLAAIAIGLAADTRDSSRKALGVIKARSPDLLSPYVQTGEDLFTRSPIFRGFCTTKGPVTTVVCGRRKAFRSSR